MVEAFFSALDNLLSVNHFLYMFIGVAVGLFVGVLPGLGGIVGMSLLLPFIYGLEPTLALAMLIGMVVLVAASDTFTSILMGIPGSSASQATVLDGFPLAKKGEAARALSAALSASLIGGIVGAVVLTLCVIVARPIILSFGSAELFMLTVFGLSMVGVLAGSSMAKGIAACALGLALGAVGAAPATGEYRMDFGTLYLSTGIPLVIVGLGIFAVPEIIDLLRADSSIAKSSKLGKGWMHGIRDTLRNWFLVVRCSGIGALIGAIPGLGGSVVDWIAYGHVVQTARDKTQFGKGDIRGVIAPESAANAKEGGALVPTVLFGIPGSGSMAIFLAGLILLGLQPGPNMAGRDLDITYTIVWSLAIANVIGTVLCIAVSPWISKLTTIRYPLIAPFMVMVISFAAFQSTRSLNDMLALLAIGAIGFYLKRFGWPRPAFLIGFVLAGQSERYFYQAVQFAGFDFVTRPIVIVIAVLIAVSVYFGAKRGPEGAGGVNTEGDSAQTDNLTPQIVFALLVFGSFAFAVYEGFGNSFLGGIFPIVAGGVGLAATAFVLLPMLRGNVNSPVNFDLESTSEKAEQHAATRFALWLVGFIAGVALVGFMAALILFFVLFLHFVARARPLQIVLLTGGAIAGLLVLANALHLVFPAGVLQAYLDLPWPFR